MKEKGHDVWVALGGNGLLKQKLETAGIYTFSIAALGRDLSPNKDAGSLKEIYSIIKNKRPDIIHLHSPKAAGLGALAGRLLGVKTIITTVHGWSFNEKRSIWEKIPIIFFSWLTMVLSHITILLSEREYAQAAYFPGVKEKLRLVPLGIKTPTFISIDGAKSEIAKRIGLDLVPFNKKTVVGTIAELHPNKGLPDLVRAMKAVSLEQPEVISVIIGDGQERQALQELIKQEQVGQNVFLAGYLDFAAEYMKAFSVFVLPSKKEGLPYAILEAGAAGLPVVATTVGGIPEIVEDMKSGILIQSANYRELSHAISFMVSHPEERRKYGAALKERVATKFSLDKMIWMVESLYQEKRN